MNTPEITNNYQYIEDSLSEFEEFYGINLLRKGEGVADLGDELRTETLEILNKIISKSSNEKNFDIKFETFEEFEEKYNEMLDYILNEVLDDLNNEELKSISNIIANDLKELEKKIDNKETDIFHTVVGKKDLVDGIIL